MFLLGHHYRYTTNGQPLTWQRGNQNALLFLLYLLDFLDHFWIVRKRTRALQLPSRLILTPESRALLLNKKDHCILVSKSPLHTAFSVLFGGLLRKFSDLSNKFLPSTVQSTFPKQSAPLILWYNYVWVQRWPCVEESAGRALNTLESIVRSRQDQLNLRICSEPQCLFSLLTQNLWAKWIFPLCTTCPPLPSPYWGSFSKITNLPKIYRICCSLGSATLNG